MDDHDLLIRIDARTGYTDKTLEVALMDIGHLKCWKNKCIGALTVLSVATGYLIILV